MLVPQREQSPTISHARIDISEWQSGHAQPSTSPLSHIAPAGLTGPFSAGDLPPALVVDLAAAPAQLPEPLKFDVAENSAATAEPLLLF